MKTLLSVDGQLTPDSSKTHISYYFDVDGKGAKLNFLFSYEPKKLVNTEKSHELVEECINKYSDRDKEKFLSNWEAYLPIQNLITISIDDPVRFRGAAHRHSPNQELFIAEACASPGLLPGKLIAGKWMVTISAHAVATETCNYKLCVLEEGVEL